ncbi:MAG: hypothetical protein RIT04_291 [Candidatus Parcubacteria bacterium]|jgi:regulator of sigma E protease
MTVIIFLIVLAVLIFVHELGHFLAARFFGIRVDAFAIGFGPKIFSKKVISKKHGETTYALNLIPFGGYVKIFGESPDADSMNGPDANRSFINKSRFAQAIVLIAGVVFNFVFAWILFTGLFMVGFPASTESYPQYKDRIHDDRTVIVALDAMSPAVIAGLKEGDILTDSSGNLITMSTFQKSIAESAGKPVVISYKRAYNNAIAITPVQSATVTPVTGIIPSDPQKYAIGVGLSQAGTLELPIHLAVLEAGRYVVHIIEQTVIGLYTLIVTSLQGKGSLSDVTGPIGIAGLVGDAAKLGAIYLIAFTALISINLGVINLIPFPALDGGRLLFVVIESITRRRIKPSVTNTVNTIGFSLLILLMIVITFHDIAIKWFVK